MSTIRIVYQDEPPEFPATDQHSLAIRYGPMTVNGKTVYVDALDGPPTEAEILAVLNPPAKS
jgi:hypothetical protein